MSLSSYKSAGHIHLYNKRKNEFWTFSLKEHLWEAIKLDLTQTKEEIEILRLSAAGLTMLDIANRLCHSLNTIKAYKHHCFKKLGVKNIAGAFSRAELMKLF